MTCSSPASGGRGDQARDQEHRAAADACDLVSIGLQVACAPAGGVIGAACFFTLYYHYFFVVDLVLIVIIIIIIVSVVISLALPSLLSLDMIGALLDNARRLYIFHILNSDTFL